MSGSDPRFVEEIDLGSKAKAGLVVEDKSMEARNVETAAPLIDCNAGPAGVHRRQVFPGFWDTLCPGMTAVVRSFAATPHGFWTMLVLSPLLLVLAIAALLYFAVFVSGPIMVAHAIWYVPKLNAIRAEYERHGIPVRAKVTKHCRTKETNQYKVTAVYEAPQDGHVYAQTFQYQVDGQSGLGINIGRVRLGFSEGPAFPQEMDFVVLPDHPASGQLREHIIQQDDVFHRALMVVVGPILYFVFTYYIPKEQLAIVSGCGFCHDALLINLVAVVMLGLNLILAMLFAPALHAQKVKGLYEGARLARLEQMDVQKSPDSITSLGLSRRGLQVSTTENGRSQAFGLSFV